MPPAAAGRPAVEPGGRHSDLESSAFEASAFERHLTGRPRRSPWTGWRQRVLVLVALAACLGLFALARWLAATPQVDATWAAEADGRLVLRDSPLPALQAHRGQALRAIGDGTATPWPVDALLLHHSPRWQVDDTARRRQAEQEAQTRAALAAGSLWLHFDDDAAVRVPTVACGFGALGPLFWPLAGVALLLVLSGVVVVLAHPRSRNLLYLTMTLSQGANLLCLAVEMAPGLATPLSGPAGSALFRLALDAITGACVVHAFALHPLRLPRANAIAGVAWALAAAGVALPALRELPGLWWWSQGLCVTLGLAALAVIARSHRIEPNPYAMVMRRFGAVAWLTLVLVTVAMALAARTPGMGAGAVQGVALGAALAWTLFLASLLLLTPFLSRSRQVLREFALLTGIGTVATSVDLLLVAVFAIDPATSLAVALFLALAVYAGARQGIVNRLLGSRMLTTERTFEHLYRAARELQATPQRHPLLLARLLSELFEPLQTQSVDRVPRRALIVGGGAALVVPMRGTDDDAATSALVLRFAQRGQRLFTLDDARLADRVVEQLRRAVAYDQAVERGRHEERLRIAQDLHDDIGARLLTLMYQAPTPEMEDYLRHTLQDLKTLTRGLAAAEHRLSHAAAEWKSDLTQRLTVAHVDLGWDCGFDVDLRLTVVQWSALTRVLRELVTNALYHGHASRIDVRLRLEGRQLSLRVVDDGCGRNPQAWAHGLGLGGVRKRIKLLGGEVHWHENTPQGIVCSVRVPDFATQG